MTALACLAAAGGMDAPAGWTGLPALSVVIAAALIWFFGMQLFKAGSDLAGHFRIASLYAVGLLYCGILLSFVVRIRNLDRGIAWVVMLCAATWLNDTFAYFGGRRFGRRKLQPLVSPGKSWEGAIAGIFGSALGGIGVWAFMLHGLPWWYSLAAALPTAVLGPMGDLSESLVKRACGVKDSGWVFPGHGGILDRIDALTFNAVWIFLCASAAAVNF